MTLTFSNKHTEVRLVWKTHVRFSKYTSNNYDLLDFFPYNITIQSFQRRLSEEGSQKVYSLYAGKNERKKAMVLYKNSPKYGDNEPFE